MLRFFDVSTPMFNVHCSTFNVQHVLRSGQAVKSCRPETKFWLAARPFPIFISTLQRYTFFSIYTTNNPTLFVNGC